MDYINRLLAPFAAYPRWLVLLCFGLAVVVAFRLALACITNPSGLS
jgi:hypothetical protein